jgi:type I restriction enzyme R subunit
VKLLKRDDGSVKNIRLIDKDRIHNNRLQVTNQYATDAGTHANRYDVTILVNGLPLVHVELKRRGVDLREAFNQINRYQRESFWSGTGLFEYVQLFVISNGTYTKYYSNTTRNRHIKEVNGTARGTKTTSNSFEFTSWWADAKNVRITDLRDFTSTFFAHHTLLAILTRYCVFDTDQNLLVMRPYQITAVEKILNRIHISTEAHTTGSISGGGYIWHTTGSGKTLTSFKTAQLAQDLDYVDKVLFVVDRKDLDYQTMKEYDRFEKGAAYSSNSTTDLKNNLEDPEARIVITTIQKLSRFVTSNPKHAIFSQHVVIIFDECHRSQFGDMNAQITKAFKRYHLFGFTGTPIFAANAAGGNSPRVKTTEQVFGDRLHSYTIVDAINDHNVLPFRVDYIKTVLTVPSLGCGDEAPAAGTRFEEAMLDSARVREVASYILKHFAQKTKRDTYYELKDQRVRGFNSLLATASITAARTYYAAFRDLQAQLVPDKRLRVAIVYSSPVNEEEPDGLLADEALDADHLDSTSREFLDAAIDDYNQMFATNFDAAGDGFERYYKDVTQRLRNRDLDLVIVVNMLLTGFDATTLNTLWVDKNLRQHGLIQAFSRTNRILNSVKTYGNIVCFRDLEEATNDALALFGNPEAGGLVILKPYTDYLNEYLEALEELRTLAAPGEVITGEENQRTFAQLFGQILKLRNILTSFDDFEDDDALSERDLQDYKSTYIDLHSQAKDRSESQVAETGQELTLDDVTFEMELVKQVEVNVDYILMLVQRWIDEKGSAADREVRGEIDRAVGASPSLRGKKDIIDGFVDTLDDKADVQSAWSDYVQAQREAELTKIIADERLKEDNARAFVDDAFRNGIVPTTGTAITKVLPPTSRFGSGENQTVKKHRVLKRLQTFFDRYHAIS